MIKKVEKSVVEKVENMREIIKEIKELKREIDNRGESIERLKIYYQYGWIDKEKYNEVFDEINKEISFLRSKLMEKIGEIKQNLEDIKGILEFDRNVRKESGINVISEEIKEEINKNIFELYNTLPQEQISLNEFEELMKPSEVKFEKERLKYLEIPLEKEKKVKLEKIIRKRKPKIDFKKEFIEFFIDISDRLFGNLSEYILEKNNTIYYYTKRIVETSRIDLPQRKFLSLNLFILSLIIISFISLISIFRNLLYLFYFALAIVLFIGLNYFLAEEIRKRKKQEIDSNLVFAIIHLSSILQSGISLGEAFEIVSSIEEYGELAKEFGRISNLIQSGVNLTDAINYVKETTISDKLKDFLDELLLTINTGRSIKEFLIIYSQSAIVNYKSDLEKLNKTLKAFSDIYVGMVLTVPMIVISMGIMLMSISQQIFGINIGVFMDVLVYVVVPIINLAFMVILDRLSST